MICVIATTIANLKQIATAVVMLPHGGSLDLRPTLYFLFFIFYFLTIHQMENKNISELIFLQSCMEVSCDCADPGTGADDCTCEDGD